MRQTRNLIFFNKKFIFSNVILSICSCIILVPFGIWWF